MSNVIKKGSQRQGAPVLTATAGQTAEPADGWRECTRCGRTLPLTQFERYKTGTRRRVCNHCKYLYYSRPAQVRWIIRHLKAG